MVRTLAQAKASLQGERTKASDQDTHFKDRTSTTTGAARTSRWPGGMFLRFTLLEAECWTFLRFTLLEAECWTLLRFTLLEAECWTFLRSTLLEPGVLDVREVHVAGGGVLDAPGGERY